MPGFLGGGRARVGRPGEAGPRSSTSPRTAKRSSRGNVYDVKNNPFKEDLDKLKTELQPSFGKPGAPVVLVEFSDFQCAYCKQEAQMLRQNLVSAYPKQVRLYFVDLPA